MLRHTAGSRVGKGTYWNFSNGERVDLGSEGILPGTGGAVYFRMPATGIVMLGPVLGLLYAAFLPFIGIAMLVKLVLQKVASAVMVPAQRSASFGWRPSESYLAGKKKGAPASRRDSGNGPGNH